MVSCGFCYDDYTRLDYFDFMVGYFTCVVVDSIITIQFRILLRCYLLSFIHRMKIKNSKKFTCYDVCCSSPVKRQLLILSFKNIMLGIYVY